MGRALRIWTVLVAFAAASWALALASGSVVIDPLALPGLLGGALFIETIFAWPGMGRLTYEAVGRRDYTMIMATTLMFSVLTMLSNLIADVLYATLDPRIRLA